MKQRSGLEAKKVGRLSAWEIVCSYPWKGGGADSNEVSSFLANELCAQSTWLSAFHMSASTLDLYVEKLKKF